MGLQEGKPYSDRDWTNGQVVVEAKVQSSTFRLFLRRQAKT